jgi:hypothetical protein
MIAIEKSWGSKGRKYISRSQKGKTLEISKVVTGTLNIIEHQKGNLENRRKQFSISSPVLARAETQCN